MKILVTGAKGFIGRNLIEQLKNENINDIFEYDIDSTLEELDAYCKDCDFVFHLAGINRPKCQEEFMEGNFGFTSVLLKLLKKHRNHSPIMLSSSIQAQLDNPYGNSKREGEELLFAYGRENNVPVYIYRFPNVFGKWCRPNYNSVIATFCYNTAHNLPVQINGRETELVLVYIDDLVRELIRLLKGTCVRNSENYCSVPIIHHTTLGEVIDLLNEFKNSRETKLIPDMTDGSFSKKLYSTYLSYLPEDAFSYPLKMNIDERGSFTEIIRTVDRGQVSINISKPGIEKGNHWHNTKNEKFVVVSGNGLIQFRKLGSDEIISYHVSGENIEVVDIPVGYTHNIINEGDTDLITVMWCNECFNPEHPDTYFEKVKEK